MLNKELLNALNEQMNHEYFAAHAYMAMAAFCDKESYEGFANFYVQQAKEERFHGKKIYDGLAQEQDVTRRFYNLSDLANQAKDYATISFLNWFLDEQVEEEAMFETHLDYLKRIGDDSNTLYLYEKELAARSFDEE
ncbi:MAG: ferritin [Staphylococcus equorum]|nr:ferritin [Staphylococcus equorum]